MNCVLNRKSAHAHGDLFSATAKTQDQVERGLLLDVIVGERPSVLKLLARKDKTLLVGRDTFLVLNLCLDVVDRITRLDVQRNRLPSQGLHEDLLARKDKTLLV